MSFFARPHPCSRVDFKHESMEKPNMELEKEEPVVEAEAKGVEEVEAKAPTKSKSKRIPK